MLSHPEVSEFALCDQNKTADVESFFSFKIVVVGDEETDSE